jgi:hypothetical protein
MVKPSDFGSEGWEFESLRVRQSSASSRQADRALPRRGFFGVLTSSSDLTLILGRTPRPDGIKM